MILMGDIESNRLTFGKWLRQQRRTLDLTQETFADQIGCARITLRRIESDALKPSKELALILLEKVGVPRSEREAWLPFTRGLADLPVKQTNPSPPVLRNNLPAFLTNFIGREKERADLIQLVAKNRLVTLTGSGGVGKTRLSIQVASELLSKYPMGIWLVELAPLTDPARVPQSVCTVLGVIPDGNTSPLEALTNYLRSKKILLVLDNCEHMLDACAQLSVSLLRSCPDLRILTSSREALDILGEQAYRVPSLSLPNSKSILNIIQESEAVTLFVERARASQLEFELTEFNASFVAQICQRLDGIALAIELAASRVKMFKVEQIAARLDDAFSLLTGGNRTALPRQQTLRALIDWSYNLLSEEEKIFLQKLSVFMGGWTLEAAEAVCENKDALELLTHLVDKSLVSVDHEHGNEARYYLLETICQFAREKLVESGNIIQLRNIHLDYFLKTAERIAPMLYTRKMPFWLNYLETEYLNFHSALEWAHYEGDTGKGLRLSNSLYSFWFVRGGYRNEGIQWFDFFLNVGNPTQNTTRAWAIYHYINLSRTIKMAMTDKKYLEESLFLARYFGDHECASRVLERYGIQEMIIGNFESAVVYLKESLFEARLAGNSRLSGIAVFRLGEVAYNQSAYKKARKLIEESEEIFREVEELTWWTLALNYIGFINIHQGDWENARRYYEKALLLAEEAHDRPFTSYCLLSLGSLALGIGEFDQALVLLNRGREMVQNTPDDGFLHGILVDIGEIARFQGDFDLATIVHTESLAYPQWEADKANNYCLLADAERQRGQIEKAKRYLIVGLQSLKIEVNISYVIPYVAYFAIAQEKIRQATILIGWIDDRNKTKGYIQYPVYQAEFDRHLNQVREQLSESEFNAAWSEGQSMNQKQILALAYEVLQ